MVKEKDHELDILKKVHSFFKRKGHMDSEMWGQVLFRTIYNTYGWKLVAARSRDYETSGHHTYILKLEKGNLPELNQSNVRNVFRTPWYLDSLEYEDIQIIFQNETTMYIRCYYPN